MAQLSIFDTVGAALRLVREQIRTIATIGAIGAVAATLLSVVGATIGGVAALIFSVLVTLVSATIYAGLIGLVLHPQSERRARLPRDARLVWIAILVIAFFLFIIAVLFFMIDVVIATPALTPFLGAIQAAGQDTNAMMGVLKQFADKNPGLLLMLFLIGALIWMFLTSRLYLAAPASVDARRVLTFETWSWTRNNMLRIVGARLLLLLPAYVLTSALTTLLGRAVGVDVAQLTAAVALAERGLPIYAVFSLVGTFINVIAYTSFEAALSSYLYLALRPKTAIPSA